MIEPRAIGFWRSGNRGDEELPYPWELVRRKWISGDKKARLVAYLKAGATCESYRGTSYCRFRCGIAEADLARTRQLAAEKPASRSAKYETHLGAGRVRFLLGQNDAAIEELRAANQLALHPMEKHTSMYWLARASQAANSPAAADLFKTVIADGFQTWMEADARTRPG